MIEAFETKTKQQHDPSAMFSLEALLAYEASVVATGRPSPLATHLPAGGASGVIDLEKLCGAVKEHERRTLAPISTLEQAEPAEPIRVPRAITRTLLLGTITTLFGLAIGLTLLALARPPMVVIERAPIDPRLSVTAMQAAHERAMTARSDGSVTTRRGRR